MQKESMLQEVGRWQSLAGAGWEKRCSLLNWRPQSEMKWREMLLCCNRQLLSWHHHLFYKIGIERSHCQRPAHLPASYTASALSQSPGIWQCWLTSRSKKEAQTWNAVPCPCLPFCQIDDQRTPQRKWAVEPLKSLFAKAHAPCNRNVQIQIHWYNLTMKLFLGDVPLTLRSLGPEQKGRIGWCSLWHVGFSHIRVRWGTFPSICVCYIGVYTVNIYAHLYTCTHALHLLLLWLTSAYLLLCRFLR